MNGAAGQRLREALAQMARGRAASVAAALERRRGEPPEPGDLFVLPATAELPVEWAVLARRAGETGGAGLLLVVPADSHPLAGSADVAVEPEGAPVLRCRFGLWLNPAVFDPDLRSGVLSPEVVAAALEKVRQVESGEVTGSPLAEEAEADPEYGDWIREVPERARSLARSARPAGARGWLIGTRTWAPPLAAAFAVLSLGLSLWVFQLRRDVNDLSAPGLNVPSQEVKLGSGPRGEEIFTVPPGARLVRLTLVVVAAVAGQDGYLEVAGSGGEVVYRREVHFAKGDEISLDLFRRDLPDGSYFIRLYPKAGYAVSPLFEATLRVKTLDSDDR